jgi:hypothetical protein
MDRARPATVTVATILMSVTGLGYVIIALPLFGQAGHARERARELSGLADLDTGGMETLFSAATMLVAMLTIVVGVTLLGVSAAVRSGSQAGRIIAWVVMGLLLLCGLGGATRGGWPDFGGNVSATAWRSDGTGRQGVSETLPDAYSTAYRVGSGIFATFAMVALIVAIVLLTRPSANRWFRPTPSLAGPPPGYHPAPYRQTGPGSTLPPKPRAEVDAELAVLVRRRQRGEITDAEYAAARTRLTGP